MNDADSKQVDALVGEMIEGVRDVIDKALSGVNNPVVENSAVSALGIAIAVATLRSVTDRGAAERIATAMSMQFAMEMSDVLSEIWDGREMAQ